MSEPTVKLWWPGATYDPGDVVMQHGQAWQALVTTGYQPGPGAGHWVRWTPSVGRRHRAVAAAPYSTLAPLRAAPPAVLFPSPAESRKRAGELMVDAVKRAAADPPPDAKRVYTFNGRAAAMIAAADAAIFIAADAESRERDLRLAEEIAALRAHIDRS
jgi:hypothetical protein